MKIKEKNKNRIKLLGIILLNIIFIGLIILFMNTQIEIEKTTTKFLEIQGTVIVQKETGENEFETLIFTDNKKGWIIKHDRKREPQSRVSMLVQTPSLNYEPNPDDKVVEIIKKSTELKDENIFTND